MCGFIKIHRKLLNWEWSDDVPTFNLFIHLLLIANFEDAKYRGELIKRGQLKTGRHELAKITGLSEMQIRTSLNKLKSTNEITIESTNKFSIITLVNYSLYQGNNIDDNQQNNQQNNQQITNKQPADNQQITTSKEEKEKGVIGVKDKTPITPSLNPHFFKNTNNTLNTTSPSSSRSNGSFKKMGLEELEVADITNMILIDEDFREDCKNKAFGWDLENLAKVYIAGIKQGKREAPKNLRKAFPAWCALYTNNQKKGSL